MEVYHPDWHAVPVSTARQTSVTDRKKSMSHSDFGALHAPMRVQVDQQFLPGLSTALLRGREVVDRFCYGQADREAGLALREDHIFRMFSSTKLVTACAMMLLVEDGRIRLDDRVDTYSRTSVRDRSCARARSVSTIPSQRSPRSRCST